MAGYQVDRAPVSTGSYWSGNYIDRLSLAGTGVNMAKENWTLALLSLFTAVIVSIRAKGLLKLIPIFCGIYCGIYCCVDFL